MMMSYEEFQKLCRDCAAASPSCRGMRLAFEDAKDFRREWNLEGSRGPEVARSGLSVGEVRTTVERSAATTSPSDVPFIIAGMGAILENMINAADEEQTRSTILSELRRAGYGS